jgi:hypothetical protein
MSSNNNNYLDKINSYSIYLQHDILQQKFHNLKAQQSEGGVYDDTVIKNRVGTVEGQINQIATSIDSVKNKINIQLKNNPYYDEYFKPNFSISNNDKFTLCDLLTEINLFSPILLIPFFNSKLIDVICSFRGYDSGQELKFNKTIQYFNKLVIKNDTDINVWEHYTTFWIFNNVDLTKSYNNLTSIIQSIKSDLTTLINDSQTLFNNNNFNSLITELQNTTPSSNNIKNYLQNINNTVINGLSEDNKKQMTLYLGMCIASGTKINFSLIPTDSTFNTYISTIFGNITGRFHYVKSPEEAIHIFN